MRFELPWLIWAGPVLAAALGLLAAWAAARRIRFSAAWSAKLAPLAQRGRISSIVLLGLIGLIIQIIDDCQRRIRW